MYLTKKYNKSFKNAGRKTALLGRRKKKRRRLIQTLGVMGTEIVLFFIPVIPLFFFGTLWAVFRNRKNLGNGKTELTFLGIASLEIAYILFIGNLAQGFAFLGVLTFFGLIIVLPIIALYKTRNKRASDSQWSFQSNKNEQ